jgi:hypothetical protein
MGRIAIPPPPVNEEGRPSGGDTAEQPGQPRE